MILRRKDLQKFSAAWLPFADAASDGLPLAQLLRLSLFQVSVGMAQVLLLGTLNRVMIVELSVPAMIVAAMIAIPVLVAPFRALLGHRSDTHRSALGWKRVPYLWFGSLWQMGGLAVMPFALLVLSGDRTFEVPYAGEILAAVAFLMTGLGMHMTQTAGLALASDRATDETRPRVVALLYVANLLGMGISALTIGWLLQNFDPLTLVKVVQGCGLATLVLNLIALWKQERFRPMTKAEREEPRPRFADAWADLMAGGTAGRLLVVVVLGTLGFAMQDVLLEPYGGEILGLSVSQTTFLTALSALGALTGFILSARWLARGTDPFRLAARGILAGIAAFSAVIFAAPLHSTALFFAGAGLIGFGAGLFAIATLTVAMTMSVGGLAGAGIALGAWGAAQATAQGLAILLGGTLRDVVGHLASSGVLGAGLSDPSMGYSFVYHLEIGLLFATLAALGPLVRLRPLPDLNDQTSGDARLRLAEFPT
ncbi:PucC family protein [Rhodobacteraceae bacterium HSP-20]|uniref:PucC family protein n=1 Tax=Paragemmobacter amnigenus TaxID=2852097 RepID=A0ABS6IZG0_9RHOB|nr:PucC family protein [Rhodobacter amnigenus]MBU9696527.1 PucC family protein [Rhodobacter amnigenus]MBV4387754.1 PucC family protein [Rhodobacter amnigenus]